LSINPRVGAAAAGAGVVSELRLALGRLRGHFLVAGVFSFFVNLLMLVPTVYMLQIYDRVLASRNETTLWMLTLIMVFMYVLLAGLEWLRSRLLIQAGLKLDSELNTRIFNAAFQNNLRSAGTNAGQFLVDFTHLRQFLTGAGLISFFDAPWTPIFIIVIFLMHPLLGGVALLGALVLVFLTWVTERVTHEPLAAANAAGIGANNFASNSLQNAEVIEAMGMLPQLRARWYEKYRKMLALQTLASERGGTISSVTKFVRITQQSLILGIGALLVIDGKLTPGAMIGASILMGRALSPVELAIGNWKGFVAARTAYERLAKLLATIPAGSERMALPAPSGAVNVEALIAGAPGSAAPILKGISIAIPAGAVVGIIGPSASGKSTFARLLVGVWPALSGKVRLDGADVFAWNKEELGPHVGYLPQDIELFEGTVAENISRFGEVDSESVIAAAKMAGMHEMVLRLAQGYDTPIGVGGSVLSAGQRQRIALARVLYGNPSFIVLDEPNSNLDDAGEAALVQCLQQLKSKGRTVIVITHRTSVLSVVDRLILMRDGQVHSYGPRDEVLKALQQAASLAQQATAGAAAPAPAQLVRPAA